MKKWNIQSKYSFDTPIVESLLKNRGISDEKEIELFINPPNMQDAIKLLPRELMQSLKQATNIIQAAIKDETPIIIHGDYDADGICATAILYNTLKKDLNYDHIYYQIPNRFEHGYGLSKGSIDAALQNIPEEARAHQEVLFITVDSGITSVEEAQYIKDLGHKLIITDHHQKPDTIPTCDCLVWCDDVVGATISWLLSKHLYSQGVQHLSLAALATVTDVQPVIGFNRSIVKYGLEQLNSNPPLGLKKLIDVAGSTNGSVAAYELGWVIGPRLNASGRIMDAAESLKLLLADNEKEAQEIAIRLNEINTSRQDKTLEMYEIAAGQHEGEMPKVIFSVHEDYHEGIIGLVAARLSKKYSRPAIVVSLSDGHGKGSARSISGVNIIEMLREFEDMFINVGGHPGAAGFTIEKDKLPELQDKLQEHAAQVISDDQLIPELDVDMEIPVDLVGIDLLAELDEMKPFGVGNYEPVFVSRDLGVADVSYVGRDKQHLSLRLYVGGQYYKAIWFNGVEFGRNLDLGDKIDLAYTLNRNEYNGKVYVDLVVRDLKKVL